MVRTMSWVWMVRVTCRQNRSGMESARVMNKKNPFSAGKQGQIRVRNHAGFPGISKKCGHGLFPGISQVF